MSKVVCLFVFDDEGYATIKIGNTEFGGKEFIKGDRRCNMIYYVDYENKPIYVDIVINFLDSNTHIKMLVIVELTDQNTIRLATNYNTERPTSFKDATYFKIMP